MTKQFRQKTIKEIIITNEISNQDVLLNILTNKGFILTQATLSRDIKELKIIKAPNMNGAYCYQLSDKMSAPQEEKTGLSSYGFISIEFSGQLAVIKTRPGYAMGIAAEIDEKASNTILGTVAGDDTILLIPHENITKNQVRAALASFMPIKQSI